LTFRVSLSESGSGLLTNSETGKGENVHNGEKPALNPGLNPAQRGAWNKPNSETGINLRGERGLPEVLGRLLTFFGREGGHFAQSSPSLPKENGGLFAQNSSSPLRENGRLFAQSSSFPS